MYPEEPEVPNEFEGPEEKKPEANPKVMVAEPNKTIPEKPEEKKEAEEKPEKSEPVDPVETAIMGKYLLRDMPFFKFEMFGYFAIFMVGVMLFYIDWRGVLPGVTRPFALVVAMIPIAIWFMKWAMFMPRKNRVPGMKIYKSGIVELGVYDIGQGVITFGKGENQQKKFISKLNKHVEASTGRPFVVVSELEGENLNLLSTEKPDMRSDELNSILEMNTAVTTKNVMKRMLRFSQPSFSNPIMLLQMMTMGLVALVALIQLGFIGGA